jgi:hypothetical protein
MRCLVTVIAGLLLAVSANTAAAEEKVPQEVVSMSGEEIRQSFAGKSLAGVYPSNQLWSEHIFADGRTDYREGGKHWQGEWWVTEQEFCFRYPLPGNGGCFRVVRVNRNCFELYETLGMPGRAEAPWSPAAGWNGRMWLASEPPTCPERPVS